MSLGKAFHFKADDLADNQRGHTSHRQRKFLYRHYTRTILGGWLLVVVLFMVIPLLLFSPDDGILAGFTRLFLGWGVPLGLFSLVHLLHIYWRIYRSAQNIKVACGRLLIQPTKDRNGRMVHHVDVGGRLFDPLDEDQREAVKNGKLYCAYYVFFYLFGSHLLSLDPASTREVEEQMNDSDDPFYRNMLQEALQFTAEDLEENRAGRISEHQQHVIRKSNVRLIRFFLGIVFLYLLVTLCIISSDTESTGFMMWGVFIACFLPISLFGIIAWGKARRDIRGGKVEILRGEIHWEGRRMQLEMEGVTHEFEVPRMAFEAIAEGKIYQLYYVPETRQVLSMERIMN